MALTLTKPAGRDGRPLDKVIGDQREHVRIVTIASTPGAGGDAITAAQVGLDAIEQVVCHGAFTNGTTAVVPSWNYSTGKLQFFETAATVDLPLDEADGTPSLAGFVGRVTFTGPRKV